MPRLTDDERKAMEWLEQYAVGHIDGSVSRGTAAARTIKAMLAQPRLPKQSSPEMLQAMWEAWLSGNPKQPAPWDRVYDALYAELSRPPEPEKREIETWHVEYVIKPNLPAVNVYRSQEEALLLAAGFRDPVARCVRVTGPHKQRIPV